jgi:release factor glutamine methyltransferase
MTTRSSPDRISIQAWLSEHSIKPGLESDSIRSDLRALLAHKLSQTTTWVAAHPETLISNEIAADLNIDAEKLIDGTPLPYLIGMKEFFGLEFLVNPAVLIPRPETELLVEHAIDWLGEHPDVDELADVGTGSGCIPIAIAVNRPGITAWGCDLSGEALRVARWNITKHHLTDRVHLIQSDLFQALQPEQFHLITANLPYIPTNAVRNLRVAKYEPVLALDGGPAGLAFIERLLRQLSGRMPAPFCILLEIEYRQAESIRPLAEKWFEGYPYRVFRDLGGLPRLVEIRGEK